jgi:hypothetical protein
MSVKPQNVSFELRFFEDDDGVHVMNPSDDEGTLCGIWNSHHNDLKWTDKKVVTCRNCCHYLKVLGSVKYKK